MFNANIICNHCGAVLRPDREVCIVCHHPLTTEAEKMFRSEGIKVDPHYGEKTSEENEEKHHGKKTKKTIKKIKRVYRKRKG